MKDNVKRGALIMIVLALAAGGAFAQEQKLSAGGGVYLASEFGGGVTGKVLNVDVTQRYPYFGVGVFGFFEPFPYLDISAAFFYGFGGVETIGANGKVQKIDGTYSGLDLGVTGKFPIAVSDALSVYPAVTLTFRSFTTMETKEKTYNASDMSAFWASLGGGMDYSLDEKLYLRVNVLYGARLSSSLEDKLVKALNASWANSGFETVLGHGLIFKAGVGYRF